MVSFELGHLLHPSTDDPKFFGFDTINAVIPLMINLVNIPIWGIIVFIKRKDGQKLNRNLILYITGFVLFWFLLLTDPFNLKMMDWYAD